MTIRGKKRLSIFILVLLAFIGGFFWLRADGANNEEAIILASHQKEVESALEKRMKEHVIAEDEDPFGEDDKVTILLLGIDSRAGQEFGHCDAIQFFELNRKTNRVQITAVPRGTYSPLPRGTGKLPSDYYVSNACALGGLEYGIEQMERITGKKAEYVAIVGFSGVLGILRNLDLPTTETLQWLRHRQGYAIGEPQRARNHSNFLKQLITKFTPTEHSQLDVPLHYLVYSMLQSDLSFAQAREVSKFLTEANVKTEDWRITLSMMPSFEVRDIKYDPEEVEKYLGTMLNPIKNLLSDQDYSEKPKEEIESELLALVEEKKDDQEFIDWAFQNALWHQIENNERRLQLQYDLTLMYLSVLEEEEQKTILENYILEMQYYEAVEWAEKGKYELEQYFQEE
jgi:hypothetical protein